MVSSFCCCSRNSDAEHRRKRPFDLPTNDTALVTLRWRYFHRCTSTNKTPTYSLLEGSKKIVTTFSRLPGKPWRQLTTDKSLQETDTYRQITGRFILQLDITQSHNYQNSYSTSATGMQYDRQLIRREQVPWPCFFKEQLQRRPHPTQHSPTYYYYRS